MKQLREKLVLTPLPLFFLLLLVAPVFATDGNNSPISDIMTVYDPAGNIFAQVSATEADEATNAANNAFFVYFLPTVPVDPDQLGNPTMFYEPGGNAVDGPWSDIFGVTDIPGQTGLFLAFASDVDGVPFPFGELAPDISLLVEEQPGVPYDITMYLSPDLQTAGFTATFISDANVPEPSTILLLGAGLAGVGLFRRRIK